MCTILDSKDDKSDLNIVMKYQWYDLIEDQRRYLLNLMQKIEVFSMKHIGTCKIDPMNIELKENAKLIC